MIRHWFDFICPFCYVGQDRTAILREAGSTVEELPFQIHPEIGPGGAAAPARQGPMYEMLAAEAERAGLPLRWSPRIPYSRPALLLAEAVRARHHPRHAEFVRRVFDAYFGRALDIEAADVLAHCLADAGIEDDELTAPAVLATAERSLAESRAAAEAAGVSGTPAWLIDGRLVVGLQPRDAFRTLATAAAERPQSPGPRG
jgi:predicted DsbA family dithiol-disulfide isomerase